MPAQRFLALYGVIGQLEAQEDLRQLLAVAHGANPGEKGEQLRIYANRLSGQAEGAPEKGAAKPASLLIGTPGVDGVEPGALSKDPVWQERIARMDARRRERAGKG